MKKLLLTLALLFAPTLAWGQCNGVFAAGTVCGSAAGGVPGAISQVTIGGLTINQALSGTITTPLEYALNTINTTSDTANCSSTCLTVNQLYLPYLFGGSNVQGGRNGVFSYITQTAATSASNANRNYVALTGLSQTNTGDGGTNTGAGSLGAYQGVNAQARSVAANVFELAGIESDVFGTAAATQKYALGVSAVSLHVNQGASLDAAYEVHAGTSSPYGPGAGFHFGFVGAELGNSLPPFDANATVFGGFVTALANIPVLNVIDTRVYAPSAFAFIGNGISISPNGQTDINRSTTPASVTALGTATGLRVAGADGASTAMILDAFAGTPTYNGRRANGTAASKTGLGVNDVISQITGLGWTSSAAYTGQVGSVRIVAAETFTNAAQGTRIDVTTTPIGSTVTAVTGTFNSDGSFKATGYSQHGVSTVAALPTCNSASEGARYGVTDHAAAPVYAAIVAAGGTVHIGVYCNGTNWIND